MDTVSRPSMWQMACGTLIRVNYEEIAVRAYFKHLRHPPVPDRAVADWLEAERELIVEKIGRSR